MIMNVKNFQWYRSVPWFLQELGYQDLMNPMHLYHVMPSLCPNMILNHQLVCLLFFVEQAGSLCVLRAYLAAFRWSKPRITWCCDKSGIFSGVKSLFFAC